MRETLDGANSEPRIVGRYALFDEIASGGMATVHLGRFVGPVGFSRTVAIKTLHAQFGKDPAFVEMFLEEARLASRIQHPNVISTLDIATSNGEVFLVMEYIAGESLAKLVRASLKAGQAVPLGVVGSIVSGMLHGLHATHEAKNERLEPMRIVHRDVSPQNVLVGLDGVARVFDFGVAKAAAMRSQGATDGRMKGKLSYMSPEQLNSKPVDRRTDVFAAGVVAWECLTGRRLFAGSDPGEVLAKVLTLGIPSPLSVAERVPEAAAEAVMRALERNPEDRWQTAREFAIEMERSLPPAAAHVVGEWVETNANPALEDRRQRVQRVERAVVELPATHAAPDTTASMPPPLANPVMDGRVSIAPQEASSTTGNAVVRTPAPGSTSRSVALPFLLGGLAAACAALGWYWQEGGFGSTNRATPPANLAPPRPEPPVQPRVARAGSPGGAPRETPAPASDAPPLLEIESLPMHVPSGGEEAETDEPPAVRTAPATPAARPKRTRPKRASPVRRAVVPPEPPVQREAPAPPPPPTPEVETSECQPPWFIDGEGIRRVKPRCM